MRKYRESEDRLFQSRDCKGTSQSEADKRKEILRLESTNRHLLRSYEKVSDDHILLIRKNSELEQDKVKDRYIIERQKQEIEKLKCSYQNIRFAHAIRAGLIYVMFLLIIFLLISTIVLFTRVH